MSHWIAFYCFNRPHVLVSGDIPESNRDALDDIDPSYFETVADLVANHFDAPDDPLAEVTWENDKRSIKDHLAYLARGSLFQASELVLMLVGAAIQAPFAPGAYLNRLSPDALKSVAETIARSGSMPNVHGVERLDQEALQTVIGSFGWPKDTEGQGIDLEETVEFLRFAANWVISADNRSEYNHFKHGLRARSGGMQLRIAPQDGPGILPENPAWLSMGSEFGSHATEYVDLGYAKDKKIKTLLAESVSRTWSLRSTIEAIQLCSVTARNLISCLKIANGTPYTGAPFLFPEDKAVYKRHRSRTTPVSRFSMRPEHLSPDVATITASQVGETLERLYSDTRSPQRPRSGVV